jgi:phosphatidate cytidylyltransferase
MARQPQAKAAPASDFGKRLLSAVVLIPPVLAAIHFGAPFFNILVIVGAAVLMYEVFTVSDRSVAWTLAGGVYVALAVYALSALRGTENLGALSVYWLFILVWAADTVAYLAGRSLGGPKLAPRLSPKKTWSGFFGALTGAAIVGAATGIYLEKTVLWHLVVVSAALGGVSQGGDLLESWFKRRFHRKDISGLIPGHGGLFDRVDGLLAAALAAWIGQMASGKDLLAWL